MASVGRNANSMETILNYENRDAQSQWSVVWSTAHIPDMDTATGGGGTARRLAGRRRLRIGALALAGLLTMHCRVAAPAPACGYFIYMMFLFVAVVALGNPLRHFEVYLGEWSISGPGRAFRIIPMLDGIGIAICMNAIIRAIICCTVAAIAAIYVHHSVCDAKLPFTYCRDFDLQTYQPATQKLKTFFALKYAPDDYFSDYEDIEFMSPTTVGTAHLAWRNITFNKRETELRRKRNQRVIQICNETFMGRYPPIMSSPAYNFFYVEVMHFRSDHSFGKFNTPLAVSIVVVWGIIWALMIGERLIHGRLIWNNIPSWIAIVPWVWAALLAFTAATNVTTAHRTLRRIFKIGVKEIVAGIGDALQVSLYIHAASIGTELVHGKGLNHYASGHIDPHLNGENVWHSGLMLLLAALHSGGASVCALADYEKTNKPRVYNTYESTLWIIPMYSKCTSSGNYSHLVSTLIFGGLMFSYMAVAFVLLKTALHTIFEYRVKLVFVEQTIVGALILSCMGLSLLFATNGGIAFLETLEAIMTGIAMPLVCLLELIGLLYVYRSHDFVSDMNIATEENACSSRISTQWQIIPFLTFIAIVVKLVVLAKCELPMYFVYLSLVPLVLVALSVPLRACHNAYVFLSPAPRRGTN